MYRKLKDQMKLDLCACLLARTSKQASKQASERPHCRVILPVRHFEVKNNVALMVFVCIALFEAMNELQKGKMSRFYGNFLIPRNPGGTEHAQIVCVRLFFSLSTHKSLGTRLLYTQ